MRVLPAVLANSGRVRLDVPRIDRGPVEWRCEEHDQARITSNQVLVHGRHGTPCAFRVRRARHYSPRLCDRIDAAFLARGGAERRPIIEVAPPCSLHPIRCSTGVQGSSVQRQLAALTIAALRRGANFVMCGNHRARCSAAPAEPTQFVRRSLRSDQRQAYDHRQAPIERTRAVLESDPSRRQDRRSNCRPHLAQAALKRDDLIEVADRPSPRRSAPVASQAPSVGDTARTATVRAPPVLDVTSTNCRPAARRMFTSAGEDQGHGVCN
jgi:hypothetical protein